MNMVPKRKYGVIRSPSNHAANTIVVIGLKYTQLVVATGPRCFITQFHNTKQTNEAMSPRNTMFIQITGSNSLSNGKCQGWKMKTGRMVMSP